MLVSFFAYRLDEVFKIGVLEQWSIISKPSGQPGKAKTLLLYPGAPILYFVFSL
jgi:hypothetical protein